MPRWPWPPAARERVPDRALERSTRADLLLTPTLPFVAPPADVEGSRCASRSSSSRYRSTRSAGRRSRCRAGPPRTGFRRRCSSSAGRRRCARAGRRARARGGSAEPARDADLAFAQELADAADAITLPRFRALDLRVETKPDLTPVSEADRAAETAIRELVARERPGEGVSARSSATTAPRRGWIVDPIDGTSNFLRGVPFAPLAAGLRGRCGRPARPAAHPGAAVPAGQLGGLRVVARRRLDGPRTGDADAPPPDAGLDAAVADLASGLGGDAAARLVPFGVRFVLLTKPVNRPLAKAISAVPGMLQVSGDERGTVLWRVDYPTGRLRVLPPGAPVVEADGAAPPATVLPAGQVESHAQVPSGPPGRLLCWPMPRTAAGEPPSTAAPSPLAGTTGGHRPSTSLPTAAGCTSPTTPGCGCRCSGPARPAGAGDGAGPAAGPRLARRRGRERRRGRRPAGARDRRRCRLWRHPMTGRVRQLARRPAVSLLVAALLLAGLGVTADLTAPAPKAATAPAPADARPAVEVARATRPAGPGGRREDRDEGDRGGAGPDRRRRRGRGRCAGPGPAGQARRRTAARGRCDRPRHRVGPWPPPTRGHWSPAAPAGRPPGWPTDADPQHGRRDAGSGRDGLCRPGHRLLVRRQRGRRRPARPGRPGRTRRRRRRSSTSRSTVRTGRSTHPAGGVPVDAGTQVVRLLDGWPLGVTRFAVHVHARSGRIAAAVRDQQVDGLTPRGADWLPPAAAPARQQVLPVSCPDLGERLLQVVAPG